MIIKIKKTKKVSGKEKIKNFTYTLKELYDEYLKKNKKLQINEESNRDVIDDIVVDKIKSIHFDLEKNKSEPFIYKDLKEGIFELILLGEDGELSSYTIELIKENF